MSRTHGHGDLDEVSHRTELLFLKKNEIVWWATGATRKGFRKV